jgi:hypothetical protein
MSEAMDRDPMEHGWFPAAALGLLLVSVSALVWLIEMLLAHHASLR